MEICFLIMIDKKKFVELDEDKNLDFFCQEKVFFFLMMGVGDGEVEERKKWEIVLVHILVFSHWLIYHNMIKWQ